MSFYLSPLVDVNEIDLTTTIPAVATSIGVIILRDTWKGPELKVKLVNNVDELIEVFGRPMDDSYEDILAAAGFLQYGENLYCTRVLAPSATFAGAYGTVTSVSSSSSSSSSSLSSSSSSSSSSFSNSSSSSSSSSSESAAPIEERGVFGSADNQNAIDYVAINTLGNASDFGDMIPIRVGYGAASNGSNQRGIFTGGDDVSSIDYITINTISNTTDFGDMRQVVYGVGATSNRTNERMIFGGGFESVFGGGFVNAIDYLTINSPSNSLDFGDLTSNRFGTAGISNATNERGVFGGGLQSGGVWVNIIDYVAINTLGNASDFGDLLTGKDRIGATSNATNERGVFGGGRLNSSTDTNSIEYITINSLGNASDFGDLLGNPIYNGEKDRTGATSNGVNERGLFGGGDAGAYLNTIDYITINTIGNASDFGDLTGYKRDLGAVSNT